VVIHFKEFHKHFIVYVYIFFIEVEFNKKKIFQRFKKLCSAFALQFVIFAFSMVIIFHVMVVSLL
jgi:hypothetical protein